MLAGQWAPVAVLLPSGKVLVTAGSGAKGASSQDAELYDPAKNTWSSAGWLPNASGGATVTLLPGGSVLVAGGPPPLFSPAGTIGTSVAALYSVATGMRLAGYRSAVSGGRAANDRPGR